MAVIMAVTVVMAVGVAVLVSRVHVGPQ
jgi:hypothetical protein